MNSLRLAFIASVFAAISPGQPAESQPAALPLMPWPASLTLQSGSLPVNLTFSVSLSGAGATDPRVKIAVNRTFVRMARQTGIPVRPHFVEQGTGATLDIIVEERDHPPPQRLGDDESYSLEVAATGARLSAGHPLGALRGIETFLNGMSAVKLNVLPLKERLSDWANNTQRVRSILQSNSLLTENLPVADAVAALCEAGEQALGYLGPGNAPGPDWKQQTLARVNEYVDKRMDDVLIQIAPGVRKLVEAVPSAHP